MKGSQCMSVFRKSVLQNKLIYKDTRLNEIISEMLKQVFINVGCSIYSLPFRDCWNRVSLFIGKWNPFFIWRVKQHHIPLIHPY